MPIIDLYSRRKKRAEQKEPDVYRYDLIPDSLRVQVRRIFEHSLGYYFASSGVFYENPPPNNNDGWKLIRDTVAREQGKLTLAGHTTNAYEDCMGFLHAERNVDHWLDLVEFGMLVIERVMATTLEYKRKQMGATQTPDDAIKEINFRFREAAVGYQYESGKIVRVDSQFIHSEVVRPALQLLADPRFEGAQEEYLAAHAHYRNGEYKDCAVDALNALESTMKAICDAKGWEYPKGARASDLIKVVRKQGLLPDYLDNSFDQLIATLQSGLPKVRGEEGGHGQGPAPRKTPDYIAAYALHLAAAKIVLLVEAFRAAK